MKYVHVRLGIIDEDATDSEKKRTRRDAPLTQNAVKIIFNPSE